MRIVSDHSRNAYSNLRLIISLAVIGFVGLAIWKSCDQLWIEHQRRETQIVELSSQIADAQRQESLDKAWLLQKEQELQTLQKRRMIPSNFWWAGILTAFVFYGSALVLSGMYWHICLKALGHPVPRRLAVLVHIYGQLGKYVPGKAMVVVMRVTALNRHAGVPLLPATIAVFIETLTMMACGAAIAGVVVTFIPAPAWIRWLAGLLTLASFLPTLPRFFRIVLRRIERSRFGHAAPMENSHYNVRLMLAGWGWMTLVWVLIGTAFWLIVLSTPGNQLAMSDWQGWGLCMATISLGVVAGFVSLIPGGAGIRESVIAVLLAPATGIGIALIAAVIARLVFLIAEIFGAGLAQWSLRRWSEKNTLNSSA